MDLISRASKGAAWAADLLAWAAGVLAVLLAVTAAAIGPVLVWRWAAYRTHVRRVSRRTRRQV